ncbi:MAG TPA: tyrosine-protein phosphatase [Pyrinomonadaceae bacterium]|nr:tyrosine-protein phosphatase [Pyrinomonadaceae bacterium]
MKDGIVRGPGILAIVFALLWGAAASGFAPRASGQEEAIPNFHQVNEHLYRGAQPQKGWVEKLTALKIKTVINLRGEDENARLEEAEARAAGLQYFNVPLPGFGRPSDEQVEKVLDLINDPQNWPVFVHCHHGEDRTGTIIAVYRISHDGWTSEQAKKEAKSYGMSRFQFGMKDYIGDYYKRRSEHPAKKAARRELFPSSAVTARLIPES